MIQGTFFNECQHAHTVVTKEQHGPHYARETCSDCRKFVRWVPKPETILQKQKNAEILTALSKLDDLNGWERQFIRDVVTHKNLSKKQQEQIFLLRDKYFAGGLP